VDRPQGDGHRTPSAPVDGPAATVHRCGEGAARDVHRYPSDGVRDRCADKAHRQRIFTGVARVLRGAQFDDCCGRVRMGWSHSRCRCWPHWSEGKRRAEPPAWLVTTGDQTWDVAIDENTIAHALSALRIPSIKTCPRRPHPPRRAAPRHPVCFILDGDEVAFALSTGSVKGKAWPTTGESHSASAMSDNPTASSPSKEKHRSQPNQTRSNTSPHASPTATTPSDQQRPSLNHSYRQASPQFGSASPTSSHDPASVDTPTPAGQAISEGTRIRG
jgi:hypothetical protein